MGMLEQNMLNITTLSFDDNMILKSQNYKEMIFLNGDLKLVYIIKILIYAKKN